MSRADVVVEESVPIDAGHFGEANPQLLGLADSLLVHDELAQDRTHRLRAIALLDDLVGLSGRVRGQLEARRPDRLNDLMDLPLLPPGSPAAAFAASLSADTTALEIDLASEIPADQ